MLERCSSRFSMILEDQDVLEAAIFLEVKNPIAKCPQHVFDPSRRQCRQGGVVVGRFNDDLMSADAIHLVKHSLGLLVQVAFDSQRRKFVGHHPYGPTGSVFRPGSAVCVWPIGQNLGWSFVLVTVIKRAKTST